MGVIRFTAAAYARVQKALLPPGRLWNLIFDSFISKVFLASGDELERVSGRSADLIEEADPRTTTELITDHERELALTATGTLQERRDRVEELTVRRARSRPVDIQRALAVDLALDPADVEVIETSRALAIAIGDDRRIYQFHVFRDPALAGTPDIAAAQITLDKKSQSHTQGKIIQSRTFKCNNPQSLCDRDLLGV